MAHPLAFATFLRDVGAPVDKHFRRQGLPALCEDANAFVPLHKAWAFFEAAAQSEDSMLGWHVGRYAGNNNLNHSLLRKLEHAPTLYQALQQLIKMISAEASHLQLGIHERKDDVLFFTHYPDMKAVPGYTSSQAYQLGVYVNIVRHYAGRHWMPPEIGIEFPVVPAITKKLFPGSRIRARQRMGYISISRSCLHLPPPSIVPNGNSQNDPIILTERFDYADTLRALIKPYLSDGYPDTSLAASLMDTSVRTLARKLSDEGRSYREVVDHLRFTEARRLLEAPDARIIDVAAAVGFDDPSHFARMFRRIGGLSPREFRRAEG